MTDEPDINAELKARGPEFTIGLDTERMWVNGIQVFPANESTILVFREQGLIPNEDGSTHFLLKNVASMVMPTAVASELRDILNNILPKNDEDAAAK